MYNNEPIYIYGTGSMGMGMYRDLHNNGIKVAGFIDHLDRAVDGSRVFKVGDVAAKESAVVILAVLNSKADVRAIAKSLYEFKRIVPVVEFYEYFQIKKSQLRFWLTERKNYTEWQTDIIKANKIWKDEKSQSLYLDIIEYRMNGDALMLPVAEGNIYHPNDIPKWINPMRLIDCGAFTGDTIQELIGAGYKMDTAIALEPDPAPYRELTEYVNSTDQPIIPFQLGAWSGQNTMNFDARGDQSSEIIESGTTAIKCVSIDDFLPTFEPTLIKMDIEGAEMEALKGAKQTISKYHPGLAVSVYHKPQDIWQIPMWVKEFGGYDLFLRVHANCTFDTVMYAVPK